MEHDDRPLDSLSSSVIEYFNEVLIHKNCVSSTFRKYSIKNNEDVEFSLLLLRSISDDKKTIYQIDSSCITEETIKISSDATDPQDLTGYRLNLLKSASANLLEAGGYELKDSDDAWVHFTTKNYTPESEMGTRLKVLCGPVVNSETKTKETVITKEDYHKIRLKDMTVMSENKNADDHLLNSLASASIKFSLLQVKSSQAVSLNLNQSSSKPRETGSKGAAFIQYNASRLAALRKKYNQMQSESVYPEMAKPEEVNFDLLTEPEEWALTFNFLLEYPSMINRISKEMTLGKSNIHIICDFLSKLCASFSVYYRRVRILLEPKDHLIQTIQARLLLAMSVEQVLENGLAILNIEKIEQM